MSRVTKALMTLLVAASLLLLLPHEARCAPSSVFTLADGTQPSDDSALLDDCPFGLNGFERNAKGTARAMDGQPDGYRFPIGRTTSLVVIVTPKNILVWTDAHAAKQAGLEASASAKRALRTMLSGLDESHAMGGALLKDSKLPWVFTHDRIVAQGGYVYRFRARGEDGGRYAVVTAVDGSAEGNALGDGALWCDSACLVRSGAVSVVSQPTLADRVRAFLCGIDYRPFWVSIKTSAVALAVSFVLGLFAAWKTAGTSSKVKGLLDSVFTIPMVLPPTVCGFLLLLLFGRSTGVGRWLIAHGVSLVFTWPAAVISAAVVSFPLVYRTALGAFEGLDPQMLDAARTLGWSEGRIFRKLMMPLGWPSIAAGTVLAFARAMGEFGCTLFFAGNYAGITQTIPIAIYFEWMGGNTSVALFWVVVVILFSFLVILLINGYTARSQRYRTQGPARLGRERGDGFPDSADTLEPTGGDVLRIDRAALCALMDDEEADGTCR